MDIKRIIEKKYNFSKLKEILENEYKLRLNIDKSNEYYMITGFSGSDSDNSLVKQCTGIIINKASNKILHYFGEKAHELSDEKYVKQLILDNIDNYYVVPYIHGYLIKIFYNNNQWNFSSSNHTNIKYFKTKESTDKSNTLYNLFKNSILRTFNTFDDFLYNLEYDWCYSFILNKENNKTEIVNKTNLKTLVTETNMCRYKKLKNYNNVPELKKFILIEKDLSGKIINKFHLDLNTLEEILK
jgi:hypothetical protein